MGQAQGCKWQLCQFLIYSGSCFIRKLSVLTSWRYDLIDQTILQVEKKAFDEAEKKREEEVLLFAHIFCFSSIGKLLKAKMHVHMGVLNAESICWLYSEFMIIIYLLVPNS